MMKTHFNNINHVMAYRLLRRAFLQTKLTFSVSFSFYFVRFRFCQELNTSLYSLQVQILLSVFSPTKGRRRNEQRINRIIVLKNSTYPSLLFQNTFLKAIFIANTTNFTFLENSRVNEALAHALRQTRLMLSRSLIFFFRCSQLTWTRFLYK